MICQVIVTLLFRTKYEIPQTYIGEHDAKNDPKEILDKDMTVFFYGQSAPLFLRPDGAVKSRPVGSDATNLFRGTLFRVRFTFTPENL